MSDFKSQADEAAFLAADPNWPSWKRRLFFARHRCEEIAGASVKEVFATGAVKAKDCVRVELQSEEWEWAGCWWDVHDDGRWYFHNSLNNFSISFRNETERYLVTQQAFEHYLGLLAMRDAERHKATRNSAVYSYNEQVGF